MAKRSELVDGPRRKSHAGPLILNQQSAVRHSFAVTNQFAKGQDKGVDGMLKAAQATEQLVFEGNLGIASVIETNKDVLCCKYTEDYDALAVGFTDGTVRLFKTTTNETIKSLYDVETKQETSPVTCIQHRPVSKNYPITNCITCTYANGLVKSWNYNFSQCVYTIREKRQTFGVTYHPRLPKFITYGDNLKIYLYDEETRAQERILGASEVPGAIDGHVSRIFATCFNPRSNHEFVSGGWDNVVQFWDLRQPHAIRHLSAIHMCGEGIDISQKGTEILTCSWQKENSMQLWDYGSGQLIVTMEPDVHESLLYCGKYLTKDYIMVGGTDKNLFRVVDLHSYATSASIGGLVGGVYSLDIGPFRKTKKTDKDAPQTKGAELASLPKMAFCSGKKLYQVEYT